MSKVRNGLYYTDPVAELRRLKELQLVVRTRMAAFDDQDKRKTELLKEARRRLKESFETYVAPAGL